MISTEGGLHLRVRHQGFVPRHSLVPESLDAADALANDTHGGGIDIIGSGPSKGGWVLRVYFSRTKKNKNSFRDICK